MSGGALCLEGFLSYTRKNEFMVRSLICINVKFHECYYGNATQTITVETAGMLK